MDESDAKNQPHPIIVAFDSTVLKFNGLLTMEFLEMQSNSG